MLTQPTAISHPVVQAARLQTASRILVVRHGIGRGPAVRCRGIRPAHCQPMFDDIARRWPELGQRFDFWNTGSPPPDVRDVVAVVFLLQDPLRELYPQCFEESVDLAERCRAIGARVVNAPESLSNTVKTTQARLWRDAGLPTPPCISFTSVDGLYSAAAEMDSPMIIKADTLHAQKRTLVFQDLQSLKQASINQIPLPGSLSPVMDTRAGYIEQNPDSPYATHFHKKRAMVFGDHVRHNHVFFADQPIVGCVSSTFGHFRSMNPIRRMAANANCTRHIESDIEFHNSICEEADTLSMAARALGVEFCAIDYSSYADGRIVLWEANPFFSLHRWPIAVLSRRRKLAERTPRIHESAAGFFRELVGLES